MSKPTLSRKEIASLTGFCTKTVSAKERAWRLTEALIPGTRKLYNRGKAISALRQAGFDVS